MRHRTARLIAGESWQDNDLVFCQGRRRTAEGFDRVACPSSFRAKILNEPGNLGGGECPHLARVDPVIVVMSATRSSSRRLTGRPTPL